MDKDPEATGQDAHRLTDLLRDRSGRGRRCETPATLSQAFAWSAIRAGTPETEETCVVVLITQRHR